ncbi:membrane-bound alpha-1,6- mannosyltransferase Initiation-specific [Dinochytrium kinnereticum]|nr:membrane-bound alpha-1,6- mannosyltransferase Initiation-specific [Dinochytrium kinnereticum]
MKHHTIKSSSFEMPFRPRIDRGQAYPPNWKGLAFLILCVIQFLIIYDTRRLVLDLLHASSQHFRSTAPVLLGSNGPHPVVFKIEPHAGDWDDRDSRRRNPLLHTEELALVAEEVRRAGACPGGFLPDVLSQRHHKERVIPKLVHQIWSHTTNLSEAPVRFRPWIQSWDLVNPGYSHRVFNSTVGNSTLTYVTTMFPENIVQTFKKLPLPSQKAAFLKYLVLYKEGGVVADMDAECLKPVQSWTVGRKGVSVVLGKEWTNPSTIPPKYNKKQGSPDNHLPDLNLATWTMASTSHHPLFHKMIQTISTLVLAKPNAYLQDHPESIQYLFGPRFLGTVLKEYITARGAVPSEGDDEWVNCGIGRQFFDVVVLGDRSFDSRGGWDKGAKALRPFVKHHQEGMF